MPPRVGLFFVAFGAVLAALGCSANVAGNCFSAGGSSGNGTTTCGTTSCGARTYCANPSGGVCSDGCTKNAECLSNETCDLTSTKTDLGGNEVGTCRVKSLSEQESDACGDAGAKADGGDASTKDAGAPKDAGRD
ncbi:MAG: hypothetical protein ABI551_10905 [Polyangiaceae bacterium]